MLYRRRAGLGANLEHHGIPVLALGSGCADLYKFVRNQVSLDFRDDRWRKARAADQNHRGEGVGECTKFTALCWGNVKQGGAF